MTPPPDAIVVWIGPALVVLVGLSVQMMLRWPLVGGFSLAMVGLYIASNIVLNDLYVRKVNMRSVAMDSAIGAALADAISSNPTVKGLRCGAARGGAHRPRHPGLGGCGAEDFGAATSTFGWSTT